MKEIRTVKSLFIYLIILIVFVNVPSFLLAQDSQTNPGPAPDLIRAEKIETDTSTPEGSPGMKVYKDPVTGEFLDSPPPELTPAEIPGVEDEATSTSSEGLEEKKVDKPGGGVMMDLKGRFRYHQKATKDAEGNVIIHCTPEVPVATENNKTDIRRIPSPDEQE